MYRLILIAAFVNCQILVCHPQETDQEEGRLPGPQRFSTWGCDPWLGWAGL